MIIKKLSDVPALAMPGCDKVQKQIVIGPDDGSRETVLRYFSLEPGGASPHHTHDFPHLVKIEAGSGMITDAAGNGYPLQSGDYIFVDSNEAHHFTNTGSVPFDFICVVPERGEH